MEENRDVLRGAALSRRNSLSPANCHLWSRSIQTKALKLPQYLAARAVALYSSAQNEVDTEAILEDALAAVGAEAERRAGARNAASRSRGR